MTRTGDSMATAAAGGGADSSVADQLRALGVKGVLVQMAEMEDADPTSARDLPFASSQADRRDRRRPGESAKRAEQARICSGARSPAELAYAS